MRQNLYLLLGGELESAQLETATEEHLGRCADCRLELESAKRSRELYLTAAVDTDSEELDLWPGIRSRLYSEQLLAPRSAPSASTPSERPRFSLLRRVAPVTAVFAAAAALLISLPFLLEQFQTLGDTNEVPTIARPDQGRPVLGGATIDLPSAVDESLVADQGGRLRPVLRGDESLIERDNRLLEEQLLNPVPGAEANGTHPFESSIYDVVNQRQLR